MFKKKWNSMLTCRTMSTIIFSSATTMKAFVLLISRMRTLQRSCSLSTPFLYRSFHFASPSYSSSFVNLPQPDTQAIRQSALTYLQSFNPQLWYSQPIVSLLNGKALTGNNELEIDTVNALGTVNGKQLLASSSQVEQLQHHIRSYVSPYKDLRQPIRLIEDRLLSDYCGELIGNQCIDFQKQDGVTEIEESIMANTVERRLNDQLLEAEEAATIVVNRQQIYVSAVSNFTIFLDLFRKSVRSLECGIPIVILGRSQTSQHSYRWAKLLVDLCSEARIDPGMITYLSCSLNDIKSITSACQDSTGNLYATCSRTLAKEIKANYPKTIASTGGPNTLICLDWNENNINHKAIQDAIACSASIESAGQCTALRHCIVPKTVGEDDCLRVFDNVVELDCADNALKDGIFAGVFSNHPATPEPPVSSNEGTYLKHDKVDAFVKIREDVFPEPGIDEYWRKVVVDFSKVDLIQDKEKFQDLAIWLNNNQPISVAINGPRLKALTLGLKLWERTGVVVNTIGSSDDPRMPPALTCQARPQDAECFGEFPPRSVMDDYTTFPVIIPSSNPSYDTTYTEKYLQSRGAGVDESISKTTRVLLDEIEKGTVRGYCALVIEYLQSMSRQNPKQGFGKYRTTLWGVQRPPLGMKTVICCGETTDWDDVAPIYVLFYATNAREQAYLSIDPRNTRLSALAQKFRLVHLLESHEEMAMRLVGQKDIFHVVDMSKQASQKFPMVGNFVSLFMPLGHVKSTMANDDEFVLRGRVSDKWLESLF